MIIKNNKTKNKDLCEAASQIQKILQNGNYELKKWINGNNEDALFLARKDEPAWKGVYIQKLIKEY